MSRAVLDLWLRFALVIAIVTLAMAAADRASSNGAGISQQPVAALGQSVTWPPSSELLVGEVVTGGSSASDEFVEIYNASSGDLSLAGLEVVYASATGSTVTKKQAWTSLVLPSHHHLLLANSAGIWASSADGLYSGGFASTGGSIVLRVVGGAVIDSLSWGDAGSQFVEGVPGQAPPAGSSLERRPGGSAGNGSDTNDNSVDAALVADPIAQGLTFGPNPLPDPTGSFQASPTASFGGATPAPTTEPGSPCPAVTPVPPVTPSASPSPSPTITPAATEAPTATPSATAPDSPSAQPTVSPTPIVVPTVSADPTASHDLSPTPTDSPSTPPESPTPSLTASPTPTANPTASPTPTVSPTASPTPTVEPPLSLAQARLLADGSIVTVAGQLTTPAGFIYDGRGAFIEDATAGLALHLEGGPWPDLATGDDLVVHGTTGSRAGQLTLYVDSAAGITVVGAGPLAAPLLIASGLVCEPFEGRIVTVVGEVIGAPQATQEGYRTWVDDGSGPVTVVVTPGTGIPNAEFALGSRLSVTGVAGQQDSLGTGAGYRLLPRNLDDVATIAPAPTAGGTPVVTASPSGSPSPSPSPPVTSIAAARGASPGAQVHVRGVITAEPGQVLDPAIAAVQDETGGILVRLSPSDLAAAQLGRIMDVIGTLAAPYGNLEIRPVAGRASISVGGVLPLPRPLTASGLSENTEGLLAQVAGTIVRVESSSTGSLTVFVADASGQVRVFADARLGLQRADFVSGQTVDVVGIVGDRMGLYRLWPRDSSDFTVAADVPHQTPAPNASPPQPSSVPVISIADALRRSGQRVAIEGTVTVQPGLLDADGGRVTLQDATAAVLVRLPTTATVKVGDRVRASGTVATYFGAPAITAEQASVVGRGDVAPVSTRLAPLAQSLEWRLVTVSGQVESVHRDGDTWRAELTLSGGGRVPINGVSRSGIPSTALVAGRAATIIGVVRRAYPTATDQRFAVVPRSAADIRLGPPGSTDATPNPHPSGDATPGRIGEPGSGPPTDVGGDGGSAGNQPLADLSVHENEMVRVGGRIAALEGPRLTLQDESAAANLRLIGEAVRLVSLLSVGDLINATGVVKRVAGGGLEIVVDDPDAVLRASQGGAYAPPPASVTKGNEEVVIEVRDSGSMPWWAFMAGLLALLAVALGALTMRGRVRGLAKQLMVRLHRG